MIGGLASQARLSIAMYTILYVLVCVQLPCTVVVIRFVYKLTHLYSLLATLYLLSVLVDMVYMS